MRAKKIILPLLALSFLLGACGPRGEDRAGVLATVFPVYLITSVVAGGEADVTLLVPPGADVHEFSLTPREMAALVGARLVIISGAGLEGHVLGALEARDVRDASKGIGLIYPGGSSTPDPHVWLDPTLAAVEADNIARYLGELHPERAAGFKANSARFTRRMAALDAELSRILEPVKGKPLVTYHASMGYLARRYGLVAYSLTGPGAESPLPGRIREVYDIVRRSGAGAVFNETGGASAQLATMAGDLGLRVCTLKTIMKGEPTVEYFESAMLGNATTIARCLGGGRL